MRNIDDASKDFYAKQITSEPSKKDVIQSGYTLMLEAGLSLFNFVKTKALEPIAIFVGGGNNGGDGLVLAKLCIQAGILVRKVMIQLVKGELRRGIGVVVALDDKPLSGIDAPGLPPVGELHRSEGERDRKPCRLFECLGNAPEFFVLLHLFFGCDLAFAGFCRSSDTQAFSASPVIYCTGSRLSLLAIRASKFSFSSGDISLSRPSIRPLRSRPVIYSKRMEASVL